MKRLRHILVGLFAKTDVAVADLEKAEIRSRWQRVSGLRDLGEGFRRKNPAADGPKQARAGPSHALKKAAAIDSVVFVVVRDIIGHNIGFWFRLFFDRLPYTCRLLIPRRFYSRIFSVRAAIRGHFPLFLLLVCLVSPTLVFAKTPRSGVGLERGV